MKREKLRVFSGKSGRRLALTICADLGMQHGRAIVSKFNNGEIEIELCENIRDKNVYIIQPICGFKKNSINDDLMELLLMIDAARRASAGKIIAVIPHFGYQRADQKKKGRVPISAKVVANLIEQARVQRVITMDLHAGQIQGFFDIPVDNIYGSPVLIPHIAKKYKRKKLIFVSPDMGGAERARAYAKHFDAGVAIIDKRRPKAGKSEVMHIVGDVEGKNCILVDDIADTCGTLINAAIALQENGAKNIDAYCVHAVLSKNAHESIEASQIRKLVVTDTIPLTNKTFSNSSKIEIVSVASLLSEVIRRNEKGRSVSKLFI